MIRLLTIIQFRPWILVSLHSSTIQLWDYRMGTLIDRFEGHDGPVRGIDFHKTQPLFVSCGDDYTVKVWSLQTRKLLFTLTGHLDYVRTVFFHNDLPWIISASDDQTIRIWNWQNRQEIACLTGHNHYVLCAQFHPKEDLIVSASLDQTVRVWDISGLRKKHSAPMQTINSFEDQLSRANANQQDIFGNTDAIVKFVLEGHDRGVNWASFHPTLPLIVSSGDDRLLKVWRMSETKAWEVDSCRGHTHNIMCCLFHPYKDIIISVGEDKSIRTWDLNTRTPLQQFKRENDKFWYIAAHPTINLFAAAHDSGVMVFKLERERPASVLSQNSLFFITNDKYVKSFEFGPDRESYPLLSLKKIGNPWEPIRNISYNPSEKAILVTTKTNNENIYELFSVPKETATAIEPSESYRGSGDQAIFISRNRFALFSKESQTIEIRDMKNSVTKVIKPPVTATDILPAPAGLVLLISATSVVLFDIQQKKVVSELAVNGVKYVSWSSDGHYVALLGKHTITIATRNLEILASLHETIRIKSAVWDDSGVLLYSTLNHLKYSLLNGDNGIIKTLDNTVYLIKVKGINTYVLTRTGTVEVIEIDPTEYRFKRALLNKNFNEVLRLIKTSNLVGQNIIGYLQKKGYPEVALQFVQDPQTRFDLAIECGNLTVALEQAKEIQKPAVWKILGDEAIAQGNHEIAELVYQKQSQFDKLSFLYLITGNEQNLKKMATIANHRGDTNAQFTSGIYLGDANERIEVLRAAGLNPLAYALAKSNGLDDLAEEILESSGVDKSQININITDSTSESPTPEVVNPLAGINWPLKSTSLSFFEQAILGQVEDLSLEEPEEYTKAEDEGEVATDAYDAYEDEEMGEDAWGLEAEELEIEPGVVEKDSSEPGVSETDIWVRNSPLAADHIAAGNFESAAQLLNRQLGVSNFSPLKDRFMEIYQASKLYLPANDSLPSLEYFVRRNVDETNPLKALPFIPGFDQLKPTLQEAFRAVMQNKPELAISLFRKILYIIATIAVTTKAEAEECKRLVGICREYILAFTIELERRSLPATELKRKLELVSYFTKPKLEPQHAAIPLRLAMIESYNHKNFASAATFATKLLELPNPEKIAEKARLILEKSNRNPRDTVEVDYDQFADFDICPASLTPIYASSPSISESFTGAKYHAEHKGTVCKITQITVVGAKATGLKVAI